MRNTIIMFLKQHPILLQIFWAIARVTLNFIGLFIPLKKQVVFSSFGGRNFDDSPRAIYDKICESPEFNGWEMVWAFTDIDKHDIPRGHKVKIDTVKFFMALLTSKVWVGNSGIDRGIGIRKKGVVRVETWHGTPLKKIGGEENQNAIGGSNGKKKHSKKIDTTTIRCAQSDYDRDIFARIFDADKDAFLMCDLPRNDALTRYTQENVDYIRTQLEIPKNKKVILYVPTYREYALDENRNTFLTPPIDIQKWQQELGDEYVMLVRAHYAVTKALELKDNTFVRDVSKWPILNELYVIADILISDYSSCFFDFSILKRPMLCFAYDQEEYEEKRGLYLKLEDVLPCNVNRNENDLLNEIRKIDIEKYSKAALQFHYQYTPYAGEASQCVVEEVIKRVN